MSLEGVLERWGTDEVSRGSPSKTHPGPKAVTWETWRLEPVMGSLGMVSPGAEEGSMEQPETADGAGAHTGV